MNTLFVGQNLIKLNRVDSTNTYAIHLMSNESTPEGTVIWALDQFEGRGQRSNTWTSKAGENLIFSLVLKPSFLPINSQFGLSMMTSLALVDCLDNWLGKEQLFIKWPNDIYVMNKKIAGILIENMVNQQRLTSAVIGIGLNVNQVGFEQLPNATSLKLESNQSFNLPEILEQLCGRLEARYLQLKSANGLTQLQSEYMKRLYLLNTWSTYLYQKEEILARIIDVNDAGKLMLEQKNGAMLSCDFKAIQFVD